MKYWDWPPFFFRRNLIYISGMKYFSLLIFLFLSSCAPQTNAEAEMKCITDSINRADSLAQTKVAAKEKARAGSITNTDKEFLTACPDLKAYLELSHRIIRVMNNEPGETLNKKFKILSDSMVMMETDIMNNKFQDMDSTCKSMFLDRMLKNATEISTGFEKRVE